MPLRLRIILSKYPHDKPKYVSDTINLYMKNNDNNNDEKNTNILYIIVPKNK